MEQVYGIPGQRGDKTWAAGGHRHHSAGTLWSSTKGKGLVLLAPIGLAGGHRHHSAGTLRATTQGEGLVLLALIGLAGENRHHSVGTLFKVGV